MRNLSMRWSAGWAAACLLVAHAADLTVVQVAPLSGVLASTGKQMVLGGKLYFDWVNGNGGIHGARIQHVVVDDGYKVDETVRLTKEALERPEVIALFGFAGTANVSKLLSEGVLEAGGAPLVAPYTGGEALRTPFNPYLFHVRAGYADETEYLVNQVATLGMQRIAVNRSTAAFASQYHAAGGGAQLYNISVVDPAERVKLAGIKPVHGLGISQVVPYPFMGNKPVVREYHALLKKYGNGEAPNYTSFEEFLGAKVLVEGLRRAGPNPSPSRVGSRYGEVTVIGASGKLLR